MVLKVQTAQLEEDLALAVRDFGKDDPIVRALQRQLEGYRSMQANRDERFLMGTRALPGSQPESEMPRDPALGLEEAINKRFGPPSTTGNRQD
jgi:hypothetical protein